MFPFYLSSGRFSYSVIVAGRDVGELFRGKAGWWLVTNHRSIRFSTLREAEARILNTCERLNASLARVAGLAA